MSSKDYSIEQLANTWELWAEYIRPDAAFSREEWESMKEERREELVREVVESNS